MENHGVLFNNWRRIVSPVVDDLQNGHGLHYEASEDLLEQIRVLRKEEREKERMKQAAAGQLSDKVALPIYGAVLALIGLDANRRISAETAVKACQWVAPPVRQKSLSVPAYNMAADIAERRRKYERAEAIQTAMLDEFDRLSADPDDWLPYRVRQTLSLYELACLLHRHDPERFARAIHHEQVSHDRANGIPIDVGTPHRIAERFSLSPEQMLGDAVGGTLKTLKKATGASTVQHHVSINEARRVTAALRIEWPPGLDVPRAPTQPAPSASAPAVAVPEPAAKPLQRQRHQEAEILRVLRELGHQPKALPKNVPGKPGVKAEVRGRLSFTVKVFNKAWERLSDGKEIAAA